MVEVGVPVWSDRNEKRESDSLFLTSGQILATLFRSPTGTHRADIFDSLPIIKYFW